MTEFIGVFLLTGLLTVVLTPVIRRVAVKVGMIDYPGARRVNRVPVPRGGGVAIYIAFWAALGIAGLWTSHLWGLFAASTVIVLTGLADDRYTLHPAAKFAGQVLASMVLVGSGTRVEFLTNPLGGMVYLAAWSVPVTVLWLVAVTNVVNFIDGLDGLAAGVAGIASIPLIHIALQTGQPYVAVLAVALAGSAWGFLPHNFNPARIFMGDSGALFLGFMLGAFAIEGALKGATAIALTIPVLALGVPVFDTAFAIIRRVRAGRPIYQADQEHLHHRLLALGLSQRQAVVLLYGLSAVLAAGSLFLWGLPVPVATGLFMLIVAIGLLAGQQIGMFQSKAGGRDVDVDAGP